MTKALLVTLAVAAATAVPAASDSSTTAGNLELKATLGVVSDPVACPADVVPAEGADCRARTGQGAVPGLGRVSESYIWAFRVGPPGCPANLAKPLARTGKLSVAGKGDISFQLADGPRCVDVEPVRNEPQEFTITGGTGSFAGASGSGKMEPAVSGGVGTETWTGTLTVDGLTFDVTAPKLVGARPKTVRLPKGAKTARVTYKVTATDNVDGTVPVTCLPRSGTKFKVGRTTVRCSATDTSANTTKASFTITVKRH